MNRNKSRILSVCVVIAMLLASIPFAAVSSFADERVAAEKTKSNGKPYYIMVNRQMNTVTVYKLDSSGYYSVPFKAMVCSCGRSGHATPLGTYTTPNSRYHWRLMVDGSYGQYASRITGSILFHSACYKKASASTLMTEEYNMLGEHASLGCVRLQVADAKWIYDNCGTGTYVTIYDSPYPGALGKPQKAVDNISSSPYNNWDPTDPATSNPWRLNVSVSAEGPGTVTGGGAYRYGETASLSAVQNADSRFDGWFDAAGNLVSTESWIQRTVGRETSYIARFTQLASVKVLASRSGKASGEGSYPIWSEVTVTADTGGEKAFLGWFDESGQKVADSASYSFAVPWDMTLIAMFDGDVFGDIPVDAWYLDDVMEAYNKGITKGLSAVCFGPEASFTRAMAVQMLKRLDEQVVGQTSLENPESQTDQDASSDFPDSDIETPEEGGSAADQNSEGISSGSEIGSGSEIETGSGSEIENSGEEPDSTGEPVSFSDVADDAWYAEAVNWAASRGIVNGVGEGLFAPDSEVTRSQMVTILGRYLAASPVLLPELTDEVLPYDDADQIPDYARTWFCIAKEIGLVKGYDDNMLRPERVLIRAEGATLMMRVMKIRSGS